MNGWLRSHRFQAPPRSLSARPLRGPHYPARTRHHMASAAACPGQGNIQEQLQQLRAARDAKDTEMRKGYDGPPSGSKRGAPAEDRALACEGGQRRRRRQPCRRAIEAPPGRSRGRGVGASLSCGARTAVPRSLSAARDDHRHRTATADSRLGGSDQPPQPPAAAISIRRPPRPLRPVREPPRRQTG